MKNLKVGDNVRVLCSKEELYDTGWYKGTLTNGDTSKIFALREGECVLEADAHSSCPWIFTYQVELVTKSKRAKLKSKIAKLNKKLLSMSSKEKCE